MVFFRVQSKNNIRSFTYHNVYMYVVMLYFSVDMCLTTNCKHKGSAAEDANEKYKLWLIKLSINRVISKR